MNRGFVWKLKKYRTMLFMLLPAVLYFFIFSYLPLAGSVLAFKHFDYSEGIFGSPWAGIDNFRFFFLSGDALRVTLNTLFYNAAFILVNLVLQVAAAILLAEVASRMFKKIAQATMFLPYFISWVVVGAITYNLFNFEHGALNNILAWFNLDRVDVYNSPGMWVYLLIGFNAWKVIGYGTVFYLAAIMSIDSELYEAADIDGANAFQRIFRITIPGLMPTIVVLVLLGIGNIFRGDFGLFYQLANNPILFNKTDVIDTYVFRSLMNSGEVSMSASIGLYQSVLCFATILITNYVIKKTNEDYSLF